MNHFIGFSQIYDIELCDRLIEHHKKSNHQHPGYSWRDNIQQCGVDKTIKDSVDVDLYPADQLYSTYVEELIAASKKYITQFPYSEKTGQWGLVELPIIQYYPLGGGYHHWHTERATAVAPMCHRHLAFMTYLNDVDDQGETEFFHQKIKVSPKKGLTLIWPADWTYTHRGIASATQEKYIITGWFSFIEPDPA
jgi:hypothetical protein